MACYLKERLLLTILVNNVASYGKNSSFLRAIKQNQYFIVDEIMGNTLVLNLFCISLHRSISLPGEGGLVSTSIPRAHFGESSGYESTIMDDSLPDQTQQGRKSW